MLAESAMTSYHADRCRPVAKAAREEAIALRALARNGYPGIRLGKGVLESLCTVGYWDMPQHQDWGLGWHRNEGLEICFLASGELHFATDEGGRTLRSGALTLTHPWQRHRLGNPNMTANKLYWLILDLGVARPNDKWRWPPWVCLRREVLWDFEKTLRSTKQNVWQADRGVAELFAQLGDLAHAPTSDEGISLLTLKINELLLKVCAVVKAKSPRKAINPSQYSVELFLRQLEEDTAALARKWSVDEMAARCGVSATHFFSFCRKITNASPVAFMNRLRVRHAQRLLAERPSLSITEVGALCGFETSQYFSTVFRKVSGVSPLAFRGASQGKKGVRENFCCKRMNKKLDLANKRQYF